MALKSMMFMMSLKKDILLGEQLKRMMSSKENQHMHMVSTTKKGSWKTLGGGGRFSDTFFGCEGCL